MFSRRLIARLIAKKSYHSSCIDAVRGLPEDLVEIQKVAKAFALNEMYPNMREWDKKEYFPVEVLKKAGDLGFAAICSSEEFGGSGLSRLHASVIFEQLAIGCVSTAAYITLHNMCCWILDKYGTEELKARFLPKMSTFETRASYCLTEPDAGSDAAALRSTVKRTKDYFLLNGSKAFISGAGSSENYIVIAKEEDKGTICLLVEKGTEGFNIGKKEEKMGWNSQPTRIISFDECKVFLAFIIRKKQVPIKSQIGGPNQGFKIAMEGLNGTRLNIASCSLGAAQKSFDIAIEYIKNRKVFDKYLSELQWNQFKVTEMAVKIHTSRLLIRDACRTLDEEVTKGGAVSAIAKLYASDECFNVVNTALQMLGGYGYLKDYPLEQYFRDLRAHQILSGANEVMRMIIGRHLLKN